MTIVKRTASRVTAFCRRFASDVRGNVAMIFAIVLPVLILMSLGGVDIHRASTVRMNLQDALDAATLAAARSQFTSDADITRVGLASLRANLAPYSEITLLEDLTTFRLDNTGAVVADARVNVTALVANIFLPPYGQFLDDQLPVNAHSEVLRSNNRIEVALVLDNTGSMAGSKLTNTKAAAIDLINRLQAADARSIEEDAIKVSLVPFSMTVRVAQGGSNSVPSYMSNANNHTGSTGTYGIFDTGVGRFTLFQRLNTTWGGCVESRPQPYDIRDTAPSSSNQATMFVPYFSPDEPDGDDYPRDSTWSNWLNSSNADRNDYVEDGSRDSNYYPFGYYNSSSTRTDEFFARLKKVSKYSTSRRGSMTTSFGPNQGCSLQPIIRLTDDYGQLRTAVNNMVATGNTNVPLGAMWGWHTLSPNAPFGDGRPYNSERLQKIIIIMTDGENVLTDTGNPNDSYYNGLGYIWQNRLGITSGSNDARRTRMDNRFDHPTTSVEDMCGNMKAASTNIEVYTIAVQVDSDAQTVLRRCATDDSHYFPVSSASGIGAAFDRIAGAIENLRISR
ncbi:MAG: pilus assembly protein [Alphaproteobacteria bacterium]|nr:pilus assembly protein [Alphaproteobacteria bacterium]MBU2378811.1 pilus assembly protein [Alphaproteobacteria bacterium]